MSIYLTYDYTSTSLSGIQDSGEFDVHSLPDGNGHPDVDAGKFWMTQNTAPTVISGFSCSASHKMIVVMINDNNTSFAHGNILLEGGLTMAVQANDTVQFAFDGANWRQLGVAML